MLNHRLWGAMRLFLVMFTGVAFLAPAGFVMTPFDCSTGFARADEDDDHDDDGHDDFDIPQNADVFYVRRKGDDGNSGTSPSQAFRTIRRAAIMAPAGSIIYVGSGTYSDEIELYGIEAAADMPLRLIADTSGFRTGDAGDVVIGPGGRLLVMGCANVQITGFTFQGPTDRCFVWRQSTGGLVQDCTFIAGTSAVKIRSGAVTFVNCTVRDFATDGIEAFGTAELMLQDCTVEGCGQSGLRINHVARISIESSTFQDNTGDGLTVEAITSTDDAVTGISPKSRLQSARELLLSVKDKLTPKGEDKVEEAIKKLDEAILAKYWRDDWHPHTKESAEEVPDAKEGKDIFKKTKDALDKLKDFTKDDPKKNAELGNTGKKKTDIYQATSWMLEALDGLAMLALEEAVVGSGKPDKIEDAKEELKKVFKEIDKGHLHHAADKYKKVWEKAIEAGGSAQGSMLGFGDDNDHPDDAMDLRKLTVSSSRLINNARGVQFIADQTFTMRYSELSQNTLWGMQLSGGGQIENCEFNENGIGGVWLNNANSANLAVKNLEIVDNGQNGLFAVSSVLTFDQNTLPHWAISGSQYAIAAHGSDLTFDSVTISDGAVRCYQGNMNAYQTAFSGGEYGVTVESSNAAFLDCTVSGNSIGLYADRNKYLLVQNTTFTDNSLWGAAVYAGGDADATTTFDACTFYSNAGGLTIVNDNHSEIQLRSGTVIRDNTNSGIHFENCSLTLNDQAGGTAWRTLRNKHGISSDGSTLTLSGVFVEDSSSYAVFAANSTLTIDNCTLTGRDGIYVKDNSSTSVSATRISATASGVENWGIHRKEGDLVVKNTVIDGFQNGVFLETAYSPTARIVNTTIAGASGNGLYLADGPAELVNTIIVGNNGQNGIVDAAGMLTHSHNLIDGFGTPCSGTTADETEIFKNARFENATAGDFQLMSGSPAINAGLYVGNEVPVDIDGVSRPTFGAYEIGAYEYASPSGSLRILRWQEQKDRSE